MQARDKNDKTLWSEEIDLGSSKAAKQIQDALSKEPVKSVSVGNLPNKGDTFSIGGLQYVVKFVDYKRGEVRAKLA
jgi:hypothetical protein